MKHKLKKILLLYLLSSTFNMAKLLKKQISDVNISENFCIFAPSLHIRGKKCKKQLCSRAMQDKKQETR